jgi:hypothetical protein
VRKPGRRRTPENNRIDGDVYSTDGCAPLGTDADLVCDVVFFVKTLKTRASRRAEQFSGERQVTYDLAHEDRLASFTDPPMSRGRRSHVGPP